MKEKPTTFQLVQLAAQAVPPNPRAKVAVKLLSIVEPTLSRFHNATCIDSARFRPGKIQQVAQETLSNRMR
jgi:hypothetical protein